MSVTDNYSDAQPIPTVQIQNVNMYFSSFMFQGGNIGLEWEKKKKKQLGLPTATLVPPLKMAEPGLQ